MRAFLGSADLLRLTTACCLQAVTREPATKNGPEESRKQVSNDTSLCIRNLRNRMSDVWVTSWTCAHKCVSVSSRHRYFRCTANTPSCSPAASHALQFATRVLNRKLWTKLCALKTVKINKQVRLLRTVYFKTISGDLASYPMCRS